jgi:hypothetical protein
MFFSYNRVLFEKFSKKGQDRNKTVTDNYCNAHIGENNFKLIYLMKGHGYG